MERITLYQVVASSVAVSLLLLYTYKTDNALCSRNKVVKEEDKNSIFILRGQAPLSCQSFSVRSTYINPILHSALFFLFKYKSVPRMAAYLKLDRVEGIFELIKWSKLPCLKAEILLWHTACCSIKSRYPHIIPYQFFSSLFQRLNLSQQIELNGGKPWHYFLSSLG